MLWAEKGINETLMDESLMKRSFHAGWAGIPVVFQNGVPYIVGDKSAKGVLPWHRQELTIYSHVLIDLAKRYGKDIPDVEFVLLTNDEMGPVVDRKNMPPLPYFR